MRSFVACQEDCLENSVLPSLSRPSYSDSDSDSDNSDSIHIVRHYHELCSLEQERLSYYYSDVVERLLTPLGENSDSDKNDSDTENENNIITIIMTCVLTPLLSLSLSLVIISCGYRSPIPYH